MKYAVLDSKNSDRLYAEQVRLLFRNAPLAYSATLVNGAILTFVLKAYISLPIVLTWFGCLLLVTAVRALTVWYYIRTAPEPNRARFWGHVYLLGAGVAGSVWGTAALVLFPVSSVAHQEFIAFVLAGMAAGGVTVLAPRMEACLAFLLPALLPLAWRYFAQQGDLSTAMGAMTLIFLVGMLTTARNLHLSILTSLSLRLDNRELQAEIAQRRRAEEALFREKDRLQTVLASISECVVITDAVGHIEYMNPAAGRLCGWCCNHALHQLAGEVFLSFDMNDQPTTTAIEDSLRTARQTKKQGSLFSCEGKKRLIEEVATPFRDRYGTVVGAVGVFRDVTETLKMTEQLAYAANHDALTGLPNRSLLRDRLDQAVVRAQRRHEGFALLFLDLDHFKAVNDSMGHAAGDALLKQFSIRLTNCVRDEDTVARLGGDEFIVLLEEMAEKKQVVAVMDKVRNSLQQPFQLSGRSVSIMASIGISMFPDDGQDAETLLKHADAAMYLAKR